MSLNSAESIKFYLASEDINFTTLAQPNEKLAEICVMGSTVMVIHEGAQYTLMQNFNESSLELSSRINDTFISAITLHYNKLLISKKLRNSLEIHCNSTEVSLDKIVFNFFINKLDFLYISCTNTLIALNDNQEVRFQFLQKKIHHLEVENAIQKSTLEMKEQTIRALKFDLYDYKALLFIPGMGLMGRLGKLIQPKLGNLYQYHPRKLTIPPKNKLKKIFNLPKISIVTPSFEQGRYLEDTLQSVLNQNYHNLEYFVKDGGSKDNSVEILQRYTNKLTGWISEPDKGQANAINLGFTHTTGEIMAWLNSDDLLLPNVLYSVADYFNTHPEIDVIYGNRLLIDENNMEIGRWILPGHSKGTLTWADFIPQETLFWRRNIWEKIGGKVDESFRFAMDWDLLVRFREAGARFAHIPQFMGAFRIHESQKTIAANKIGRAESQLIQKRILGKIPNRKEIRKAILPFLIKHIICDFIYLIKSRYMRKKYEIIFAKSDVAHAPNE